MKRAVILMAGGALLLLGSGCALFERGGSGEADGASAAAGMAPERRIADDFLHALMQLDGYGPDGAAVRFSRHAIAEDPFVAELESLMRAAGYAVRVVEEESAGGTDVGAGAVVAHRVEADGDDGDAGMVHTLSVGQVQMRRRYVSTTPGLWEPGGSLYVRGADASGIRLDEDDRTPGTAPSPGSTPPSREGQLASAGDASSGSPAEVRTRAAPLAAREPVTTARPLAPPAPMAPLTRRADAAPSNAAPSNAARSSSGADERSSPEPARRAAAPLAIDSLSGKPVYSGLVSSARRTPLPRNMMELGESNYASMLDAYGNVDELILVFPNDSLVLGDENKRLIRETLDRFDPDSDVLSIVGCSLGPTSLENGNEALALGRANRVKEELLFAGVPRERILEEGCWAGEATTKFPSRGVVLTHRRRAG